MRKRGPTMFNNNPPSSMALHPLFGTGMGFAPDIESQTGYAVLPEASGTLLEVQIPSLAVGENTQPPYGLEGMMPCSMLSSDPMQPGLNPGEEGVGGAGSFLTVPAYGAKG